MLFCVGSAVAAVTNARPAQVALDDWQVHSLEKDMLRKKCRQQDRNNRFRLLSIVAASICVVGYFAF